MIRVDRPRAARNVLEALARLGRSGRTELDEARDYYGQEPPPTRAYKFTRYKEREVCVALDEAFHGKCAYCETPYSAAGARDVEHYRPKGGVTESKDHPGYWWLAAVWSNLLPSCPSCNQRRYQTVFEPGMTSEEFERARLRRPDRLTGKANSFPVRNGEWVKTEKGRIAREDPLLIDPCKRDPADHLEFRFDWDREGFYIWEAETVYPFVWPKVTNGEEDPYGRASIDIYGLNRAELVKERSARVRELQPLCRHVVDVMGDLNRGAPTAAELQRAQERVARYRADLEAWAGRERTHAGMVRAFLVEFASELHRAAAAAAAANPPQRGAPTPRLPSTP